MEYLLFTDLLPKWLEIIGCIFDNRINSERLRDLFNQYVYVHPDKEIMDEYTSPDELDSLSYAFMEIQKVIGL